MAAFGGIPLLLGAVFALIPLALVWLLCALFGRRVGRLGGWIIIALLIALPIWFAVQCHIAMAVPVRYEGNNAIDNDGAIRSLALTGSVLLPATFMSILAMWLSIFLFARRPKEPASAVSG